MWTRRSTVASGAARVLALGSAMLLGLACGGDDDGSGADGPTSELADEGRRIALRSGCAACHGADGEGGIGPAWTEPLGTQVELADGTTVTIDEAYLTRSIAEPSAQLRAGYSVAMPANDLTDDEIEAVVAYIVELAGEGGR